MNCSGVSGDPRDDDECKDIGLVPSGVDSANEGSIDPRGSGVVGGSVRSV